MLFSVALESARKASMGSTVTGPVTRSVEEDVTGQRASAQVCVCAIERVTDRRQQIPSRGI